MIPILYSASETQFTSNGLGRLIDATSCEVTEERNGQYELVMKYPVDGQLYDQLVPGNYIAATHEDSNDIQPFQIYQISAPLHGLITINAWHISYMLNGIIVGPYTASTCAAALSGITSNSMNTNPFTFWTDKTLSASFKLEIPAAARSVLGGMAGSILDIYGPGEFEFDKWDVKFHTARGANNGVSIRYGKNIRSLDYQLNAANQYNAVAPYWTNDETAVVLDHLVVRTGQTADRAIALDMSSEFETAPTTAQLEAAAQAYIDASTNYQVKDNLKIDIVPIWEASEYQYNQNLDAIKLCDTVTIIYGKYNINATAKVIKVVYDTLLNRYSSIELGEPQTTLSQQIAADVSGTVMEKVPDTVKRMTNVVYNISTKADIITAGTNITIVNAYYYFWGKLAYIYITWRSSQAITIPASGNIADVTVGTLLEGKRPPLLIRVGGYLSTDESELYYNITNAGNVTLKAGESTGSSRTIAANTNMMISAIYLLA